MLREVRRINRARKPTGFRYTSRIDCPHSGTGSAGMQISYRTSPARCTFGRHSSRGENLITKEAAIPCPRGPVSFPLRGGSGSSLPSPITSTPWFDEQFSISLKHNDIRGWLVELVRHHILHDFALYVQYRHQFVIELVVKKIDGANSS